MKTAVKKTDLDDVILPPETGEQAGDDYDAWKEAQVRAAVEQADSEPDRVQTHDQVFGSIKAKFRV